MNALINTFPKPWIILIPLCGLFLFGCAFDNGLVDPYDARARREAAIRREKSEQPSTEVAKRDVLMPAMSSINSRIRANEKKIEEWREVERKAATMALPQEKLNRIDECRSHLQHILLEYNALQKQLQQETQVEAAQLLAGNSLLQLNQQDIDYLESGCDKFLAELKNMSQSVVATPVNPQIKAAYDSGDYGQVVNLYNAQSSAMPNQMAAAENTFHYGQALLKNYQEAEGQKVLVDLLSRVRQQKGQDELVLRLVQSVADLNFSMEAYDEARKNYEELIRLSIEKGAQRDEWAGLQLAALQPGGPSPAELKEYSGLLKNYLSYAPKRDGNSLSERADKFLLAHPGSRLAANVHLIKKTSRDQAEVLGQGSRRGEPQAGDRAAQQPTVLGGQPGGSGLPPSETTPPATGQVANVPGTTVTGSEKGLQEDYDKGVAHLQAKEYDKAIERFNRLQRTPYEVKARPQLEEASKLAAQDLRQKAAELFVRATNSRDTEEKRKLLLSSRDLLQSILVKYPQSGLSDKVQKNLGRIEAELRTVEASGSARPSTGGAYVPPSTGTSRPVAPATSL